MANYNATEMSQLIWIYILMYFLCVTFSSNDPVVNIPKKKNCWSRSWPFINISSLKMHIPVQTIILLPTM